MIPFSSFGTNSISWNSEEDLFSVQYENVTVKDILDYIEKHSKYIFIYSVNACTVESFFKMIFTPIKG